MRLFRESRYKRDARRLRELLAERDRLADQLEETCRTLDRMERDADARYEQRMMECAQLRADITAVAQRIGGDPC